MKELVTLMICDLDLNTIPNYPPANDPQRVKELRAFIAEYGIFNSMVVIDEQKRVLIGRSRVKALARLGIATVEAAVLTEKEAAIVSEAIGQRCAMLKEKQNSRKAAIKSLSSLMLEFPDYPVVPMVSDDVVADDSYSAWYGSIGDASLGALTQYRGEVFYDEDDVREAIGDFFAGDGIHDDMEDAEFDAAVDAEMETLTWRNVIFLRVDPFEAGDLF